MKTILAFFAVFLLPLLAAAETATGLVYEDLNQNAKLDAMESGIAGIAVSNGVDVVLTDDKGRYSLPVGDDTALFVIKPADHAAALDHRAAPQYYYLHKPAGSPELEVPGVAPTGPLPESVDFPLYKTAAQDEFTAILFGDPQPRGLREVNFVMHDVVEELIGVDAAFGVSLGDIVADDPALFDEIGAGTAQIGAPWYYIFGNHDHNRDMPENRYADETFERFFGPSTYAFEYGDAVFIGLNNVFYKPDGGYESRFTDEQVAFVENYLALVPKEKLVVLMMHIPIMRTQNREPIFRVLEQRPHTLSIAGHAHQQMHFFLDEEAGWQGAEPHHHLVHATVSGSWWCGLKDELGIPHATMNDGAPNGYSFLHVDGTDYSIRFKASRRPADYQMNIHLPSEIPVDEAAGAEVLANVFAGSARSTVRMKVGDGAWIPMEQTLTIDPANLMMHERTQVLDAEVEGQKLDELLGWKMDYPSKSRHIWRGELPEGLEPGTYTVTVETTDMFGQTDTDHRILRVR